MSDRLVVHHDRLILHNDLPTAHLALVEPLSVGFHAVARGRISAGETVVVLGGGMIGVGAISRGARVIAVEVSEEKRKPLLELGVEKMISSTITNVAQKLESLSGGRGPDVDTEVVGLPGTFRSAVDLVCFAGRVVYVGYAKTEVSYNTSLFNLKELNILGSRNATPVDFLDVIKFLSRNSALADSLISRVLKWADADQAFTYWEANRDNAFKVLIDLTDA